MSHVLDILVVDDDMNDRNVHQEFSRCILDFSKNIGMSKLDETNWNNDRIRVGELLGIKATDLWGVYLLNGRCSISDQKEIELQIRLIAFSHWDGAVDAFHAIRPRIVLTDLFDGYLDQEDDWDHVKKLPGRTFAQNVLYLGVPSIIFSSSEVALTKFSAEWQELIGSAGTSCYYFTREDAFRFGKASEALAKIWKLHLASTIWSPELDLAVRGERDSKKHRIVFFDQSNGKTLSERDVSPATYVHYYLWAHASVAARFFNFDDYDAPRIHRRCPILGSVPDTRSSQYSQAQTRGVVAEFNDVLKRKYKSERSNILLANIDYFDVPVTDIPVYFDAKEVAKNLTSSLAPVLSNDGKAWLGKMLSETNDVQPSASANVRLDTTVSSKENILLKLRAALNEAPRANKAALHQLTSEFQNREFDSELYLKIDSIYERNPTLPKNSIEEIHSLLDAYAK